MKNIKKNNKVNCNYDTQSQSYPINLAGSRRCSDEHNQGVVTGVICNFRRISFHDLLERILMTNMESWWDVGCWLM